MKARTFILSASAFLALAGPAVHPAGAMIPRDEGITQHVQRSAQASTAHVVKLETSKHAKASSTTIHTGAFAPWAYFRGGRSATVGKAVTAAGKQAATQAKARVVTKIVETKVPVYIYVTAPSLENEPGGQSAGDYCGTYPSDFICELVPPAPAAAADEAASPDASDGAASEQTPVSLETSEAPAADTSSESSTPSEPTSDHDEDC